MQTRQEVQSCLIRAWQQVYVRGARGCLNLIPCHWSRWVCRRVYQEEWEAFACRDHLHYRQVFVSCISMRNRYSVTQVAVGRSTLKDWPGWRASSRKPCWILILHSTSADYAALSTSRAFHLRTREGTDMKIQLRFILHHNDPASDTN